MRRDWDMFKGESSKLLADNIKAVVDVGIEDKDTFLGNIIDHERMFYDVTIYINYSTLEGHDVAIRSWEGASSLGIREGVILKTDEEFEDLVKGVKDEVFEGLIGSELGSYTKEEVIGEYKGLDNKRGKLYLQKIVEMAWVISIEEGTVSFVYNEPELYLENKHIQGLMKAMHKLVDNTEHRIVLITKSAVVLQNVESNCVYKENDHKIERVGWANTFGENVSTLEGRALGLNVKESYYYKKVKELIDEGENELKEEFKLGRNADMVFRLLSDKEE